VGSVRERERYELRPPLHPLTNERRLSRRDRRNEPDGAAGLEDDEGDQVRELSAAARFDREGEPLIAEGSPSDNVLTLRSLAERSSPSGAPEELRLDALQIRADTRP
jgi:hypothetical protein